MARISGDVMAKAGGIGPASRAEIARALRGQRFLTPEVVAAALGIDPKSAAKKLSRWAEAGWMRRVRRGLYFAVPVDVEHPETWAEDGLVMANQVWKPCYFTGWTAANHWALSEQLFRTTVLKTSGRVRRTSVRLLDADYLVMHTEPSHMEWGLSTVWHQDVRLKFADAARTVVDMLDKPRIGGGIRHVTEILDAYLDEHDPERLLVYGDRLGNNTVFKRLGYLLETTGRSEHPLVVESQNRMTVGLSLLDPDSPDSGPRVPRWGLRANVRIEEMSPS
jgi:predicted transcriptional regulator of viral defense system